MLNWFFFPLPCSGLFSYSTHLEDEQNAFILMLLGRSFGSMTANSALADVIGLRSALWLGTVLCGVGLIGVDGAGYYHTIGLRETLGRSIVNRSRLLIMEHHCLPHPRRNCYLAFAVGCPSSTIYRMV
ncbi:hypothetical protein BV898_12333 [Hypsibius exemplaris]|uniref:Uncharacterized protein n=1 Tax=Hypsibius exemplaris TaxID=2072580 RepID=A0A1W0WE78_HYPEX|nr:hypothetical protein BV898_12333 [Hypsibius exemplaris]